MERQFFYFNSELSFNQIKNDVPYEINIHMSSDCEKELFILKAIHKELGNELLSKVLLENTDSLTKAICTKSQNGDEHKSKFDLLVFILQFQDSLYFDIFGIEQNCNDVVIKLERLLRGKKWEKMIGQLYVFFLKKYSYSKIDELATIEKKFLSLRKFKIEDYLNKEDVVVSASRKKVRITSGSSKPLRGSWR